MKTALYHLARRLLSQQQRNRINTGIVRGRIKLAPLINMVNGRFDAGALRDELTRALPQRFDALMIHCSFDDLLPMYSGGVMQFATMLLDFCGADRTLVMPAFTFGPPGRDIVDHFAANPHFDARRQPSQMGLLSEIFRRTPGVNRSLHPTHSVCALGPHAREITSEHHLAQSTFGARSPFAKMADLDTIIVGLGKPYYRCLTQIHAAEDLLGDRYPLPRTFRELNVIIANAAETHSFRLRVDVSPFERRLDRLPQLLKPGVLCQWGFHGVPMFWTHAGRITSALREAALRGKTIYAGPTLA